MKTADQKALYDSMIQRLRVLVARSGTTPTALALKAGLHHDAVQRKLSGRDKTLMKETTFAALEKAADELAGLAGLRTTAMEAELDEIERELAQSVDELVQLLIDQGVLTEDKLPEHLRRLLERRRLIRQILAH